MHTQINPVINCQDARAARAHFEIARTLVGTDGFVHVDVADGTFTDGYKTWDDSHALRALLHETKLRAAVHVMVRHPELAAEKWLKAGASRLIVHFETAKDPAQIISMCRTYKAEFYLAIKHHTSLEHVLPALVMADGCLVLAVAPGLSGQTFAEPTLAKIAALRKTFPKLEIAVDGGVTPKLAKRCSDAGATQIAAGAYIFNAKDPLAAYHEFVRATAL